MPKTLSAKSGRPWNISPSISPGTKPFHLKAVLAPSFERDKDSGRTGEVEIWWQSPTRWKRELRSADFHQIKIVDGGRDWQKNEGDYFPEWLREIALELIRPVPPLEQVLDQVKIAEVRRMMGQVNIDWITNTGTAEVRNIQRSGVALRESTGQLLYAHGFGWGGDFKDSQSFHGRMVARTVSWGSPEVTAKVTTLEDLAVSPDFFDAAAKDGDPQPLQTELIDEGSLRKNLLPAEPIAWPPLQDGPLEGNVTTEIVVDREGKVREMESIISENNGIRDAGRERIQAMRFKPFLQNGVPVQVLSQITVPFKTVRPPGSEAFESARTYFERGRKVSFLAAGTDKPYSLRAEFEAKGSEGKVDKGHYEDTWLGNSEWRREASFGKSRYVRSKNGEKRYELAEGPDAGVLRFVLQILEPIPATDTFVESDWRIKRDTVSGVRAVRVLAGYESPDGKLDPEQARGYWFDDSGLLLKTYLSGVETEWSDFQDFSGSKLARQIDVSKNGMLAMRIHITEVTPPGPTTAKDFELKGHEWQRAFTAEER
jgi:Gram-negative bacterial TonB protein C-terminal